MNLAGCRWCLKTYLVKEQAVLCCKEKRQEHKKVKIFLFLSIVLIIIGMALLVLGAYKTWA